MMHGQQNVKFILELYMTQINRKFFPLSEQTTQTHTAMKGTVYAYSNLITS